MTRFRNRACPHLLLVLSDRPVHLLEVGELAVAESGLLVVPHVGAVDDDVVPLLPSPVKPASKTFPLLRALLVGANHHVDLRGGGGGRGWGRDVQTRGGEGGGGVLICCLP